MMNEKITTLERVREHVEASARNCNDELVPVHDIFFDDAKTVRIGLERHALRTTAARGIANRLGIPYPYLERCPKELQSTNLNHWIRQERNNELLFRFDGGDVRAVFTTRYKAVDNLDVIRQLDSLGLRPETKVQAVIDEGFMLLSIPDVTRAFSVAGNDRMMPGVSIGNSEVGLASLTISAFLLRLVCTNGLIARDKVAAGSYRHISERVLTEFPQRLRQVTEGVELQHRQLTLSRESPVRDPLQSLESFNRQFQLGKDEQEAVLQWAWPQEAGDTLFHLVNTYTRASQYPALAAESAFKLQRTGGQILAMVS